MVSLAPAGAAGAAPHVTQDKSVEGERVAGQSAAQPGVTEKAVQEPQDEEQAPVHAHEPVPKQAPVQMGLQEALSPFAKQAQVHAHPSALQEQGVALQVPAHFEDEQTITKAAFGWYPLAQATVQV